MNYSTIFLILLTVSFGAVALWRIWRGFLTYSLDYLRFFFFRLAADLVLTMALSALYLAGTPLYNIESWTRGSGLLALLFIVGVVCIYVATASQVAAVCSIASVPRRRWFSVAYALLLLLIVGSAGIATLFAPLRVWFLADRAMFVFAVFSRFLALCVSIALVFRYRDQSRRAARKATVYVGCYFVSIDGSWLMMYALGMMGLLHARFYDGLHLTRLLLLSAVVAFYLDRFLDAFEGTRDPGSNGDQLDPHLVKKHGISKREEEIIQHLRQGMSNEEIAEKLFISTRTVKGHLYKIFQKTSVKNRLQLANLFASRGQEPGP